jgi:hypothetical protein
MQGEELSEDLNEGLSGFQNLFGRSKPPRTQEGHCGRLTRFGRCIGNAMARVGLNEWSGQGTRTGAERRCHVLHSETSGRFAPLNMRPDRVMSRTFYGTDRIRMCQIDSDHLA